MCSLKSFFAAFLPFFTTVVFAQQSAKSYLVNVGKYNEASGFEDPQYNNMTWQKFYKLDEPNEIIDPVNYDFDLMNAAVFFAINKYRESKGLPAFKFDAHLRDAATIHTNEMEQHNFFAHDNPYNSSLKKFYTRIEISGFKGGFSAENISREYQDLHNPKTYIQLADEMILHLSLSKPHNANMLNPNYTNLGCALLFDRKSTNGDVWYYRSTHDFGGFAQ
jgi:uncharacterized protein YkwD